MSSPRPPHEPAKPVDVMALTADGPAHPLATDTDNLSRGAAIGRYLVLSRLGAGGMGVVYAAYDPDLDRKVAIKLLRPREQDAEEAKEGHIRLFREAQAMARLSHPNVITVYDVSTAYGQVFVAMEFVDGYTLRDWLDEKRRTTAEIAEMFLLAGRGLAAAHLSGMVHRDFKPENVLVSRDGQVRVSDFGLARKVQSLKDSVDAHDLAALLSKKPPDAARQGGKPALKAQLTHPGAIMGTPAYMAPEQFRGDATDQRTDIFSFCVAFWEALYGKHPFSDGDLGELYVALTQGKLRAPPPGRKVPSWLHLLLVRGLATEPQNRYQSIQPLLHELARDRRRAQLRTLGVLLTIVLAAAGLWSGRKFLSRNEALCRAAPQRMHLVWNETARSAMQKAIVATGHPLAEMVSKRIAVELERYTTDWSAMRVDACAATHVRGEQSEALLDLRMGCLDRRLQEVEALLHELQQIDRTTIERIVSGRYDFTPISTCADVASLRNPVPLPDKPEMRVRVEALYRELAALKAREFIGKYSEILPAARAAVETARTLHYEPSEAEAFSALGFLELRNGDITSAERDFRQAAEHALSSHHGVVLARALTILYHVVGINKRKYDQAELLKQLALAAIKADAGAALFLPQLLSDSCVIATAQELYFEAAPLCEEAIALQAKLTGEQSAQVAAYMNNLASVYRHSGRTNDALQKYQRALEIILQVGDRQNPLATMTLRNMASLLYDAGRFTEAADRYDEVLRLVEQKVGGDDPKLLSSLQTVVLSQLRLKRFALAQANAERMLRIAQNSFGFVHQNTAIAHNSLAQVLFAQKHYAESLQHYELARTIYEEAKENEEIAENLVGIAGCLRELGRTNEGVPLVERALSLIEKSSNAFLRPNAEFELAQLLWLLNNSKYRVRAYSLAQSSLQLYERAGPVGSLQKETVAHWLVQRKLP